MNDFRWSIAWAVAVFGSAFDSPAVRGVVMLLSAVLMVYWTFRYEYGDPPEVKD